MSTVNLKWRYEDEVPLLHVLLLSEVSVVRVSLQRLSRISPRPSTVMSSLRTAN